LLQTTNQINYKNIIKFHQWLGKDFWQVTSKDQPIEAMMKMTIEIVDFPIKNAW